MSKKKIKATIQKAEKQPDKVTELTHDLKRLQAEFENYKKRIDRDKEDFRCYSEAEMIKEILPTLDNLELALKNTDNHKEFVKGMELVYSQISQMLEDKGLKKIECVGKMFDPHMHEALLSEKSDKEEETILEELQKGFMLKEKVLRHSKVKVAKR